MRWKVICLIGATLLLSFGGIKVISGSKTDHNNGHDEGRILVALRKMGHEILLQHGDSSSRVLPVEKTDDYTYFIKFQKPFSFTPDSLVKIVGQYAKADHLPEKYLVEVIDRESEMVNYSYMISDSINTVIPCVGRSQPRGSYYIKIQFEESLAQSISIANIFPYLFFPLTIILLVAGLKRSRGKVTDTTLTPTPEDETSIKLGDFVYSTKNQVLRRGTERIELSAKEAKILSFFAAHPNEMLDRDYLLKEVWENEGVFVGRSLDVFISKLRKKLQSDPKIRIVNIHGRGYKLEVLSSRVGV